MNEQKDKYTNLLDSLSRDHSSVRIPAARYKQLSARYQDNLDAVNEMIEKNEMAASQNSRECNAEMLLDYITAYQPGDELDYSRLRCFLDRGIVHERTERYSRKCNQKIEVFFK